MKHILPELPYAFNALEPYIDARTMQIHHDGHHAAYVGNLNKALEGHEDLAALEPERLLQRLESVPEAIRTAVRNNAGGHVNHSMFWKLLSPKPQPEPGGELGTGISRAFGSLAGFKESFAKAAMGVFGSGWAWLVLDRTGHMALRSLPNQDHPILAGEKALLGLDVWEHAYYLKYQNKRADYVGAWWQILDWREVERRYAELKG